MNAFQRFSQHPFDRLRALIRADAVALALTAAACGALAGVLVTVMGWAAQLLHDLAFGPAVGERRLSAMADVPWERVLIVPAAAGLLLSGFNMLLVWRGRSPSPRDPVEANALHGGHLPLSDSLIVAAQNLISNGGGASVGLEAGYAQVGAGASSSVGEWLRVRRADLRVLVACGAAGGIAAAFAAPLAGAFYAFELILGTYAAANLAPVTAAAVAGSLAAAALGDGGTYLVEAGGLAAPGESAYAWGPILGALTALAGIAMMRGVGLAEGIFRKIVPWAPLRPALGGLVVGGMALITPAVLSAGHGALHLTLDLELPLTVVAGLLVLKAVASAVSVGSGFRGGLFFASLLLGALLGKSVAALIAIFFPPGPDPLLLAVIGMAGFATSVVGAPMAMTFLVLETTQSLPAAGMALAAVVVSALLTRRLFGYSFATWRFHMRGEAIRSAHDIGWLRELTVGRLMRRDVRTVREDTRLSAFRRDFPIGSTQRVVVVDQAGRYAGIALVTEAHANGEESDTISTMLHLRGVALLPAMNAKQAMVAFDENVAEAMVVLDGPETRQVIGLVTEAHLLRRYGEELERRRREESGLG